MLATPKLVIRNALKSLPPSGLLRALWYESYAHCQRLAYAEFRPILCRKPARTMAKRGWGETPSPRGTERVPVFWEERRVWGSRSVGAHGGLTLAEAVVPFPILAPTWYKVREPALATVERSPPSASVVVGAVISSLPAGPSPRVLLAMELDRPSVPMPATRIP